MGKDSPSPPAVPDYPGAAQAQGVANEAAARLSGRLSNPNIYGPYGSQTVTFGSPSFDQANYDKAMSSYQANPRGAVPMQNQFYTEEGFDTAGYQNAMNKWAAGTNAPTREQYTTNVNADQPTVTQTLNPQAQKTLDAQQRVQTNLANLGEQGIGTAQKILGTPFSFGGPGIQTSLGNAGPILTGVNPAGYEAQGRVTAGPIQTGVNPAGYEAQGRLDTSRIAAMPVNAGTTAQQAIMSRLDPSIARNRVSTETQLINQGLRPGGEAYNNAINLLGQQENDQRTQAALQGIGLDFSANQQGFGQATQQNAIANQASAQNLQNLQNYQQQQNAAQGLKFGQDLQGTQFANQAAAQNLQNLQNYQQQQNAAQGLQFNQGLVGKQFENTAEQNAFARAMQLRGMPLNEITALMSGSQIQNPTFQPYQGQSVAPAPVAQAAAQQAQYGQNIYNQQMGQSNANTAGLYSLGGAGLGALGTMGSTASGSAALAGMFSDRRLKSNIERIGTHPLGIGIYEYDIFGKRDVGMMADEVESVSPASVITHPSGFQMVDYRSIPNG